MAAIRIALALLVGLCAYYFYPQETFSAEMVRGMRVLVTGSSSGIGEQMAYEFARMGAHLMLTARRENRLQEVMQKCQKLGASSVHYVVADMSNLTSAQKVVEETKAQMGGLDQLVLNHVGGTMFGPFQGTIESVIRSMNVNFFSYVQLTISAMDLLQESKGNIVVISSMSGRIPGPFAISYSAAKFALEGFYSSLRAEMRLRKIDLPITVAVLGYIDTDMALNSVGDKITQKASSKEDCARQVVKGGVLRYREVFYPYWAVKPILLYRELLPDLVDQVMAYGYKLENIL
ncbi:hydroxysteroid 11-beta-dehydrogenase 1-like protein A [Python bivittatus]|uniref:Hydroxysteroid 11-beta-dehydrogenase 1-like protein A n=1 Tax=Python bivittatus TaxID=176946 RepID=A0A9F2R9Y2_PYTBI|nr:hydroxysteroid 11-beta-dehydrogenase 1-like protein A [Python bivittatus]